MMAAGMAGSHWESLLTIRQWHTGVLAGSTCLRETQLTVTRMLLCNTDGLMAAGMTGKRWAGRSPRTLPLLLRALGNSIYWRGALTTVSGTTVTTAVHMTGAR